MKRGLLLSQLAAAAGLLMLLAGCATPPGPKPEPREQFLFDADAGKLERELLRSGQWGVALSGGGVRSAMYAVGALKALHEQGILPKTDVLSSVSGGGYAAYWLYANHLRDTTGSSIGDTVFSTRTFPVAACELISHGNFVTNRGYASIVLSPFRWGDQAVAVYTNSIERTFGAASPDRQLHELLRTAGGRRAPYWVINTSVNKPKPGHPLRDGVFELTPKLSGTLSSNYTPWAESKSIAVTQAVAISGAAVAPLLKQELPHPSDSDKHIALSDGGHTENLGAFALIRRGIKNIIIVDAELDPELKFDAYVKLRDRLKPFKSRLHVPDIEARLEHATQGAPANSILKGTVTSEVGAHALTVYYLKMSLPTSMKEQLELKPDTIQHGRAAHQAIWNALIASRTTSSRGWYAPWDCGVLAKESIPVNEWLLANVADYSATMNRWSRSNKEIENMPAEMSTGFPHYTTNDQSFYIDQALAFIGLGYFQACELGSKQELGQPVGSTRCVGIR